MHSLRARVLAATAALALAASAIPAEAGGSIRDAAAREAAHLAREAASQPPFSDAGAWARLRDLPPGESVDLTTREWHRVVRTFVAADDGSVILVNATAPGVPASVRRRLEDLAARAPHLLVNATRGEVLVDDQLQIGKEGVFVEGRRISSLQAVLETRTREEVYEIAIDRPAGGFWGHLGPFGGYFVGALAGGYGAGLLCRSVHGKQGCDTGAFLTGMLTGGVVGASYGYHSHRRVQRYTLYHAP